MKRRLQSAARNGRSPTGDTACALPHDKHCAIVDALTELILACVLKGSDDRADEPARSDSELPPSVKTEERPIRRRKRRRRSNASGSVPALRRLGKKVG